MPDRRRRVSISPGMTVQDLLVQLNLPAEESQTDFIDGNCRPSFQHGWKAASGLESLPACGGGLNPGKKAIILGIRLSAVDMHSLYFKQWNGREESVMRRSNGSLLMILMVGLALVAGPGVSAFAQEKPYPTKVHHLPGHLRPGRAVRPPRPADSQPILEKILGQKVIVDYKVGAAAL